MAYPSVDPQIDGVIGALADQMGGQIPGGGSQVQPPNQQLALDMSDLLRPGGRMPTVEYGLPQGMGTQPYSQNLGGVLNNQAALQRLLGAGSPMVPGVDARVRRP